MAFDYVSSDFFQVDYYIRYIQLENSVREEQHRSAARRSTQPAMATSHALNKMRIDERKEPKGDENGRSLSQVKRGI